ncbi:MAG: hypothetical protein KC777_12330, partial [Cyanobacteria bacterium HKST-UBA02]|nr:hypothetical protein [Cyanobacteria bacterium HKST-UBA02]
NAMNIATGSRDFSLGTENDKVTIATLRDNRLKTQDNPMGTVAHVVLPGEKVDQATADVATQASLKVQDVMREANTDFANTSGRTNPEFIQRMFASLPLINDR